MAVELADQLMAVLEGRPALYAVNAPMVPPEVAGILAPFMSLAQTLGNVSTQLAAGQIESVELTYTGEIAESDTSIRSREMECGSAPACPLEGGVTASLMVSPPRRRLS